MTTQSTHGSGAALSISGTTVSPWTTQSELKRVGDKSEVTAYGSVGHEYADGVGLKAHTFTCSGWYDTTETTGTAAILNGQEGQNLAIIYGPSGGTSGKIKHTFTAHLDDFTVTAPVAEIVKWSATFTVSGEITDGTYS